MRRGRSILARGFRARSLGRAWSPAPRAALVTATPLMGLASVDSRPGSPFLSPYRPSSMPWSRLAPLSTVKVPLSRSQPAWPTSWRQHDRSLFEPREPLPGASYDEPAEVRGGPDHLRKLCWARRVLMATERATDTATSAATTSLSRRPTAVPTPGGRPLANVLPLTGPRRARRLVVLRVRPHAGRLRR